MSEKSKNRISFQRTIIVLVALAGMLFSSFGPVLMGNLLDDAALKSWVEIADSEEEPEENEGRKAGGSQNRLLEEETKHFLDIDLSYLEILSGRRHVARMMHDIGYDSQHLPSILIPPPELG